MGLRRERCNASELVDRQIEAGRGGSRAIIAEDATLTYDELRRQVARAGRMLRELGVRREERVLLVLDDTTVFPIAFLSAMRIGALPVPVSPLDKDENIRHFVNDSYARLVVTDAQLSERLSTVLNDPDIRYVYYWHQHEKTKSSMVGEWFVTGDRYERDADGIYTYVGRVDDMLKVGGLWVSPIDMEHVLSEHPRVDGVGVVGIKIDGATRIAAYVQCGGPGGDDTLAGELQGWCKERMRRYEYPHIVRFVDELPRTLTGKVQRFRLRERAEQASHDEASHAALDPDPGLSVGSP
jgi:acyl-coenzyme A synthetase/AMP-(fatty) acid ligase